MTLHVSVASDAGVTVEPSIRRHCVQDAIRNAIETELDARVDRKRLTDGHPLVGLGLGGWGPDGVVFRREGVYRPLNVRGVGLGCEDGAALEEVKEGRMRASS